VLPLIKQLLRKRLLVRDASRVASERVASGGRASMNQITTADIEEFREQLLMKVDSQAEWRERKAAEHPNDGRNQQSAESLRRLHEQLETLPADHALWQRLANVYRGPGAPEACDQYTEVEQEHLRTYGFHSPEDGEAVRFLTEYVRAL
jgi:hypothetical protein